MSVIIINMQNLLQNIFFSCTVEIYIFLDWSSTYIKIDIYDADNDSILKNN